MQIVWKLCYLNNLREYLKQAPGLLSPSAELLTISSPESECKSMQLQGGVRGGDSDGFSGPHRLSLRHLLFSHIWDTVIF